MKWKTSVSLLVAVALGLLTAKVGRDMLAKYRAELETLQSGEENVVSKSV